MAKPDKINIEIDADVKPALKAIKKLQRAENPPNYRKTLYILYIPLLLIEWAIDAVVQMISVLHKSIETLTLSLESYINNVVTKPHPPAKGGD